MNLLSFTGNRRCIRATIGLACVMALATSVPTFAQDVLIRNATVHTASVRGTLQNTDVLVRGGKISAIGNGLSAAGVQTIDAQGHPLTPALFAGISGIGLDEVSIEETARDTALILGEDAKHMVVRPEFDVTLAYNPESLLVPIARVEGLGFTILSPDSRPGGSFIAGQGAVVRLDGSPDPIGPKVLFVSLGSEASPLTGSSRAGQWMLLDQLIDEVRGRIPAGSDIAMLTPSGRDALRRYLEGNGRIVVNVDRASDIRQLLRWSQRHGVRVAIASGVEAWRLAPQIAAANVPVLVDTLVNLPSNFDQMGATLENAARLRAAGVEVSFTQSAYASHNARKIRQSVGNAVANGLPWEDGLAGLTRVPAEIFGVADRLGTIEVGKTADLVLWSGDPLDMVNTARQVWFNGRSTPMRSRQTDLRDRYLQPRPQPESGTLPLAYPVRVR